MFKRFALLLSLVALFACVKTKPVVTPDSFTSELHKLDINIDKKMAQYGPYILKKEERGHSELIRENYYPYIETGKDGTIKRMLYIGDFSFWSRYLFYRPSSLEGDSKYLAGGISYIGGELYSTQIKFNDIFYKSFTTILKNKFKLEGNYIAKQYWKYIQGNTQFYITYIEKIEKENYISIYKWQQERQKTVAPTPHNRLNIIASVDFKPKSSANLFIKNFGLRADTLVGASKSKSFTNKLDPFDQIVNGIGPIE